MSRLVLCGSAEDLFRHMRGEFLSRDQFVDVFLGLPCVAAAQERQGEVGGLRGFGQADGGERQASLRTPRRIEMQRNVIQSSGAAQAEHHFVEGARVAFGDQVGNGNALQGLGIAAHHRLDRAGAVTDHLVGIQLDENVIPREGKGDEAGSLSLEPLDLVFCCHWYPLRQRPELECFI